MTFIHSPEYNMPSLDGEIPRSFSNQTARAPGESYKAYPPVRENVKVNNTIQFLTLYNALRGSVSTFIHPFNSSFCAQVFIHAQRHFVSQNSKSPKSL